MEIVIIFERSLYAARFDDNEVDEFERLLDQWRDVEYLTEFFNANIRDLQSGYFGEITVEQAVRLTIRLADNLENRMLELAENGQTDDFKNLQSIFKPLDSKEQSVLDLQMNKAHFNWLRVYGIRIAKNLFVISGGAIKLTQKMNDRAHTQLELNKLNQTKDFLRLNFLSEEEDFENFEFN